MANDTNSNSIDISLVHAQIGCSFIAAQPSAPKGIILAQRNHSGPVVPWFGPVPSPTTLDLPFSSVPRWWHLTLTSSWGTLKPASGVEAWPQHRMGCFQETRAPGDLCVPQAVSGLALISLVAASLVK